MPTFYQVLGVPTHATEAEIQAAYERHNLARSQMDDVSISGESSNILFAYFTLANGLKRRVYDRYGQSGLCILETEYATWARPEMVEVVVLHLLRTSLAKLMVLVGLVMVGLRVDRVILLSYLRTLLPIGLVCCGRAAMGAYVLRSCFNHTLVTPGYADLHLVGVPGHPRYPTRLSFVGSHLVDLVQTLLFLTFIVILGLKLDSMLQISSTLACIPLYPFLFGRHFFHVLQLVLVVLKLDGLALQGASWQELLCLVYIVNLFRLMSVLWHGYKSGKKDLEVMQYFQDYHIAAVRTKFALWALLPFRSWVLLNLTLGLITAWLAVGNMFPFTLAISPILCLLIQDTIGGMGLSAYLLYLRNASDLPQAEKVVFSPSTHPDAAFLKLPSLPKLTNP
ncbi:hypothetical protein L0F63_003918 [Massospora cicadina]|nr:hypothetical protein L0F63_003918 [Massospora cicadina]